MKTRAFWNTHGIRTYSRALGGYTQISVSLHSIRPNYIVRDHLLQNKLHHRRLVRGYKQKVEKWDSDSDSDASDDEKDLMQ